MARKYRVFVRLEEFRCTAGHWWQYFDTGIEGDIYQIVYQRVVDGRQTTFELPMGNVLG